MIRIDGRQATCSLDLRLYSIAAIKKAAYRMAGRCTVALGELGADSLQVIVLAGEDADIEECVRAFLDEALDQDLRERVAESTGPLRDLILAHAYSRTRLATEA